MECFSYSKQLYFFLLSFLHYLTSFQSIQMKLMFYRFICWLVSMSGCFWQVFYISKQYFAYEVVTSIDIARPSKLIPPAVELCFKRTTMVEFKDTKNTTTAASFLKLTPQDIAGNLELHSNHDYNMMQGNFIKNVSISSSLKKYHLCYKIVSKPVIQFNVFHIMNGLAGPKFYVLHINASRFPASDIIYIFLHSHNKGYHGLSDSFAEHQRFITNKTTGAGHQNHVTISYSHFQSNRLGPPFKTQCLDYATQGLETKSHCFEKCLLQKSINTFKKLPFSVLIDSPIRLPIISKEDNSNELFMKKLGQLQKDCGVLCKRKDCFKEEFIPKVFYTTQEENIMLELYGSNEPTIASQESAYLNIIDYITYIVSCISFWFGFSPVAFLISLSAQRKEAKIANEAEKRNSNQTDYNNNFFNYSNRFNAPINANTNDKVDLLENELVKHVSLIWKELGSIKSASN